MLNIIGFVLFFLAGLGFGYAAPGWAKLAPLIFPILLALGAMARDGFTGEALAKLAFAIVLTLVGIVLGMAIDARSRRREAAGTT